MALTCGFAIMIVFRLAVSAFRIPYGVVIALSGECCIGCNSAHFHPGLLAVPQPVRRESLLDWQPGGKRGIAR